MQTRTGRRSPFLAEIYRQCTTAEKRLSPLFYSRYLAGKGIGSLTPFEGIEQGPGVFDNIKPLAAAMKQSYEVFHPVDTLLYYISDALRKQAGPVSAPVAVAVSGGIDSWLLVAVLQSLGYQVHGFYLHSGIPGYCEREQVSCFAQQLQASCEYVDVTEENFLESLPAFLQVTGMPIYNLHPVSKLLLAQALQRRGIHRVIAGDGADQVMRHDWDCDLLPLTLACFAACDVQLVLPFLAPGVLSLCRVPDSNKLPIRLLAQRFSLPSLPKSPTLFPPLLLPQGPYETLPDTDQDNSDYRVTCLQYTTALLRNNLEHLDRCD